MPTSKLQRKMSNLLSVFLGQYTIRENIRPNWLITRKGERLELDFFIEELQIAIEVQGRQHYTYIPYFHKSYEEFRKRLRWDNFKRKQCLKHGIQLIEVDNEQDAIIAIDGLSQEKDCSTQCVEIGQPIPSSRKFEKPKGYYYILSRITKCRRKIRRERSGLKRPKRLGKLIKKLERLEAELGV